jgi:hypothetical protein
MPPPFLVEGLQVDLVLEKLEKRSRSSPEGCYQRARQIFGVDLQMILPEEANPVRQSEPAEKRGLENPEKPANARLEFGAHG